MPHQQPPPSLDHITCPKCQTPIPITEAIHDQLAQHIRHDLQQSMKQKEVAWEKREAELHATIENFPKRLNEKVEEERKRLETESVRKAKEAVSLELKDLQTEVLEKNERLQQLEKTELELRKRERSLEDSKKNLELEVAHRLSDERQKVEEATTKRILEEQRFKDAEKDKKLQDAIKANEELRRKLEQGSQQTQGEVMELELEELLKASFPFDDIQPVAKGKPGADMLQYVFTRTGMPSGCIIWESKRTKNWIDGWIPKLKDDQRAAQADVAVLVTEALPKDIRLFAAREGIWVTHYSAVLGLAAALREGMIQVSLTKRATKGKDEKMEALFAYLTGPEFRQRAEAIVETFTIMKADLEKEKLAYSKQWAKREKQIDLILGNTAGMFGDLQGLIGEAMPSIPALEAGQDDEDTTDAEALVTEDLPV